MEDRTGRRIGYNGATNLGGFVDCDLDFRGRGRTLDRVSLALPISVDKRIMHRNCNA
jgi:hypothetical protein